MFFFNKLRRPQRKIDIARVLVFLGTYLFREPSFRAYLDLLRNPELREELKSLGSRCELSDERFAAQLTSVALGHTIYPDYNV